ncbi:MAG TPA: hypothetical protein DF712_01220 [Balneola sp.]|jgi:hypothetical protein|nr:hypothetical protein [Bacteroidota bacterium]MAC06359.1 hypothetical protein [Balneola sp.]MAO76503.1 hypothetical protein [Balneola sp.]MBF65984.1 hypothetical protein [Balneola sp.]HAH52193.1 hypothetical protein [Balneola sp.]
MSSDTDSSSKKKLGSRKRGVSDMFRTSYRTHMELSAIADNKSNIMISINGIIISIIIASISPKIDSNPWLLLPTSILLITCLLSLVYAVLSARPRVSKEKVTLEDVRENRANILFFGNFYTLPRADYVEGMEELMQDSERLYDNMARDLHGLGVVLAKKYRLLRIAYNLFMGGLVLSVISFIFVFFQISWS